MLSNYLISLIRTAVPVAIGTALTWLASTLHIVISPSSQAGLVALCVGVLSSGYYALVRLIEKRYPQAGVLLGAAVKPQYTAPSVPVKPPSRAA